MQPRNTGIQDQEEFGAGGVLVNPRGEVLLIQDPDHHWVFPKGHALAGEAAEQTAEREVFEETGVRGRVLADLGQTTYTNARGVRRRVRWFLMQGSGRPVAEGEHEALEALFFPPSQAALHLSFAEDLSLLDFAERELARRAERRWQGEDLSAVARVLTNLQTLLEDLEGSLNGYGGAEDGLQQLNEQLLGAYGQLAVLNGRLRARQSGHATVYPQLGEEA